MNPGRTGRRIPDCLQIAAVQNDIGTLVIAVLQDADIHAAGQGCEERRNLEALPHVIGGLGGPEVPQRFRRRTATNGKGKEGGCPGVVSQCRPEAVVALSRKGQGPARRRIDSAFDRQGQVLMEDPARDVLDR